MKNKKVKKVTSTKTTYKIVKKNVEPTPMWVLKVSAEKRAAFAREFQARLDQRVLNTFGTYPTEGSKIALAVVQHAYHIIFNML
jgi:hypothetical protein